MDTCELEASVPTGFEGIAAEEIKEKFSIPSILNRGNISFHIPISDCTKVLELRSIDNVTVILNRYKEYHFSEDKEQCLADFKSLIPNVDWKKGLEVWEKFYKFRYPISPIPVELPKDNEPQDSEHIDDIRSKEIFRIENELAIEPKHPPKPCKVRKYPQLPAFRTTCYRIGERHSFGSNDAAAAFGGATNDYFHWNVDMGGFDIETILKIDETSLSVGIQLSRQSLHNRNLCQLGPTALRATICYNMLRMCNIQPGEIICDPMAGGCSIPIEGSLTFPSHYICGDNHPLAGDRSVENIKYCDKLRGKKNEGHLGVDVFSWDVLHLPLRDSSLDVFITDLPFGKRIGSKALNRGMYPKILTEMARVCRPETSRACFLTQDKRNIVNAITEVSHLWRQGRVLRTNVGGLIANVHVLHRTRQLITDTDIKTKAKKKRKRKKGKKGGAGDGSEPSEERSKKQETPISPDECKT